MTINLTGNDKKFLTELKQKNNLSYRDKYNIFYFICDKIDEWLINYPEEVDAMVKKYFDNFASAEDISKTIEGDIYD